MAHPELDSADERLRPLLEAIGRAVLGAATLEKMLLVDIAQRRVTKDGFDDELSHTLSELEAQPAGRLLQHLRELGIAPELAGRINEVLKRRNRLVHHFLEDPEVLEAIWGNVSVDPFVDRVDELAADCQRLVNEIGPLAFSGAEKALGVELPELAQSLMRIDPESVEDEELRSQVESLRPWGRFLLQISDEEDEASVSSS
jgi:hypothetical protein